MHCFLSWLEVKKDGGVKLLHLTDREIYTKKEGGSGGWVGGRVGGYIRGKITTGKNWYTFGHENIRKYYQEFLGDPKIEQIKERMIPNFWDKKLPPELAEKINNFDAHWGKLLRAGAFSNEDLAYMVRGPDQFREVAWEQLLNQGFPQDRSIDNALCDIIIHTPDPLNKERAWSVLCNGYNIKDKGRGPHKTWAMQNILKHRNTPLEYREKALQRLKNFARLRREGRIDSLVNKIEREY